ncbi:MAG: NAD-dependent epimerase/dehydratase family protein [Magnetococcales bacterium]|nr:NAD-dependent epimerase/dehydratase family protein [Magnetococcales bacterium]
MALYLITGGCGFIGSHLADALLARGDQVRVLDDLSVGKRENLDPACELIVGDIADTDDVTKAVSGVAGVFHLAAVASVVRCNEDWLGGHRANLTGTIQVMDQAVKQGGGRPLPVVYASSAAVYGDVEVPVQTEQTPLKPLAPYGADKMASELHARAGAQVFGLSTVGFRFFNVYGPRQDPSSPYSGVISIFVDRILAGQGVTIFGDGAQVRDFVFVGDVVRYLLAGMDHCVQKRAEQAAPVTEVFNVCTGKPISIKMLATSLFDVCGREANINLGPERTGDIKHSLGSAAQVNAFFDIKAETDLQDGLQQVVRYLSVEEEKA